MSHINRLLSVIVILVMMSINTNIIAKTLKMGVDIASIPFVYIDGNGQIVGFETEFVTEIGKLNGFEVQIVPEKFPAVFDDLANDKIDFIGHIYYSKERAEKYLLSEPYYVDKLQLVALKETPVNDPIQENITISTLWHSPLAAILNTVAADHANIQTNIESSSFLAFKSLFLKKSDVLLATETGIHAYTSNYAEYQYKTFPMLVGYPKELPISFLAKKGDTQLISMLNEGVETIKANGTYQRLKEKYKVQ